MNFWRRKKIPNEPGVVADKKEVNLVNPESQNMYRRLVETSRHGIYMADDRGVLFYINQAMVDILGFTTKEGLLGMNLAQELLTNTPNRKAFLRKLQSVGFVQDFEVDYNCPNGIKATLSVTSRFIRDEKEEVIGFEGVITDITEKKKLETAVMSEKIKLEQILGFDEHISTIRKFDELCSFIVDKTSKILEAGKCSLMLADQGSKELRIVGSKGLPEDVVRDARVKLGEQISGVVAKERKPLLVKNIEYDKPFQRANRSAYAGRSFMSVPIQLEDKFFGVINVADKQSAYAGECSFTESDLKVYCAIAREVAGAIENVKLFEELNLMTVTDPLTHIYNYRQFSRSLKHEILRIRRTRHDLCLIMMDVDHFKTYNDTFGHLEGDHLLQEVSRTLKSVLRETDIVCRYAGDEFVVIFPDTDLTGAEQAARKINEAIAAQGFKRKVTVSIGVAHYTEGMTPKDLILKADKALYSAKEAGRACYSSLP